MPVHRKSRIRSNNPVATSKTQEQPIPCPTCGKKFKRQGFKNHETKCKVRYEEQQDAARAGNSYDQALKDQLRRPRRNQIPTSGVDPRPTMAGSSTLQPGAEPPNDIGTPLDNSYSHGDDEGIFGLSYEPPHSPTTSLHSGTAMSITNSADDQRQPPLDENTQASDFKTEYNPRSKRPTLFQTADEFRAYKTFKPPSNPTPWHPFRCEGDFEFAEVALDASLNKAQVDTLLKLFSRVAKGETHVTFKNEAELRKACDAAAEELTPFVKYDVTAPYKREQRTYEVHARSVWHWVLDLLNNPLLAPHFVWDAERLYKHNGVEFERFYDEPWTADRWWDIQSSLPPSAENAVPLALILYADKSKLSSFGTVKGYPVVVRCANLPAHIRNGNDIGGGTVVGWLPIVPECADEEGKLGYTTLKRVVWHQSFLQMLQEIIQYSRTGYAHMCYDKIERWLFPLILILSADYEEQCMMSLIRGRLGKCPCPVCLVPLNELHNLTKSYTARFQEQAQSALKAWEECRARGEDLLKQLGLRPVENVFWLILYSDPHLALSFDLLHSLHLGIWGKHILEQLKLILGFLGRDAETVVEKYVADFPSWRKLSHFTTVINITFSDGNKMRDLAKQVFYSLLNVFTKNTTPEGYALLQMLQNYLELDALISLDVHTEHTLLMIERALLQFNDALKEYIELAIKSDIPGLKVDWDFPKVHLWKHVVRDIRSKGVARNFSTRPNESMHGALREAYNRRSNGRDIAHQILRVDHQILAAKLLRQRIDSQNLLCDNELESHAVTETDTSNINDKIRDTQPEHFYQPTLGASCNPAPMQAFEVRNATNNAFIGIRKKFAEFLNSSVRAWGYQNTGYIKIPLGFEITEHRYLKVNYGSTVDWRETTDYLRSNPSFHGKPRYDCALIQLTLTKVAFVRLLLVFSCHIPELNGSFDFALVQPYSTRTGISRRLDRDLGLIRVKAAPTSSSIFIPTASIIRGAVLAPDTQSRDDYIVFSYLDGDMFLRLKDTANSNLQNEA